MYEFIHYQVGDVMTTDVITVDSRKRVHEVEEIFETHDFNGLPVVDDNGKLAGMLTKLDLLKAFVFTKENMIPRYQDILKREIGSLITRTIDAFHPETPLNGVLQRMIETGHKSFPVMEGDRLVGIVAREDILKALHRAAEGNPPARLANH